MDLKKLIQDELDNIEADGRLANAITKQTADTVIKICTEVFGEYSAFGKSLKQKLVDLAGVSLEKLTIPSYASVIEKIITETLVDQQYEHSAVALKVAINKTIGAIEKKKWLLSEIIDMLIKSDKMDPSEGDEISFEIDQYSMDSYWVRFGVKGKYKSADDLYTIALHQNGEIWYIKAGSRTLNPLRQTIVGWFDKFLFNLWASDARVEIDETKCDEIINGNDY